MTYKQHSQNLSHVDRLLQRIREIARIKTGNASESPGNPEYVSVQEDKVNVNGRNRNPQSFHHEIVMAGNADAQSNIMLGACCKSIKQLLASFKTVAYEGNFLYIICYLQGCFQG